MIKQVAFICFISVTLLVGLAAQDASQLLGQNPTVIVRLMGAPDELSTVNLAADEVAVIFVYQRGVTLYWLDSQVVQVVYDRSYRGAVLGAFMGASQQRVEQNLGAGQPTPDDAAIYELFTPNNQLLIASLRFERGVLVQATVQLYE